MIEDLMSAAKSLTEVMARENVALRAMDLVQAVALLEQKGRATAAFSTASAAAAASGLSPAQRRHAIEQIGNQLRELAADNRALLERAMLVQRRILGTVAEAAPKAMAGAPRYDARGGVDGGRRLAPVALSTRA